MLFDTMRAMEGSWSRLPDAISERVLSLLPVPALCRCRSVCKTWNELFRKRRFLDLCDLNVRNEAYLFVTRHSIDDAGWCRVDDAYRQTTCFLDLDERRWYSIPADASLLAPTIGNVPRLLAMADGLVCELSALPGTDEEHNVVLFDPVAKSRWELPASTYDDGPVFCLVGDVLPAIVTVVDNVAQTFKVFLMNSPTMHSLTAPHTRLFVYESSTGAWRGLPDPPERLGVSLSGFAERELEESAVFFQGNLYTISWDFKSKTVLLSYNLEENIWREVLAISRRGLGPGYPQLVVTGNRLFMAMWMDYTPRLPVRRGPMSSCANEDGSTSANEDKDMFEIKEVLVDENSSRLMVQISSEDLGQIFGEPSSSDLQVALTNGFPLRSNSVVLISDLTGKSVTYDVRSGSFGALPAHPLKQGSLELEEQDSDEQERLEELEEEEALPIYRAKLMNLSLRKILSGCLVTSGSRA